MLVTHPAQQPAASAVPHPFARRTRNAKHNLQYFGAATSAPVQFFFRLFCKKKLDRVIGYALSLFAVLARIGVEIALVSDTVDKAELL